MTQHLSLGARTFLSRSAIRAEAARRVLGSDAVCHHTGHQYMQALRGQHNRVTVTVVKFGLHEGVLFIISHHLSTYCTLGCSLSHHLLYISLKLSSLHDTCSNSPGAKTQEIQGLYLCLNSDWLQMRRVGCYSPCVCTCRPPRV